MGAARQPRKPMSRGPLREVYVARTAKEPQKRFERFQNQFGRYLGSKALINTVGGLHLTFLETYGLSAAFRSEGYTPTDIRQFRGALDRHLKENLPDAPTSVEVNAEKPLRWMSAQLLALNITRNEGLQAERDAIEDFLKERFGELPRLRSFEPHITLGRVICRILPEERSDPTLLVPSYLHIPDEIALNGLETYLGRIHADESQVYAR